MATKRKVEIYSAGCPACEEAIEVVKQNACPACNVVVHNMEDMSVAKRASELGIRSVPAIVINGQMAECCTGNGVELGALQAAGLGSA